LGGNRGLKKEGPGQTAAGRRVGIPQQSREIRENLWKRLGPCLTFFVKHRTEKEQESKSDGFLERRDEREITMTKNTKTKEGPHWEELEGEFQ